MILKYPIFCGKLLDFYRKLSIAEKFGMRTRTNKVDPVCIHLVDQQEVAPNMAFPVICPLPF